MKVAISGAGITGLALANYLAGHGVAVVLLERAPGPREQGYLIDFFGPGFDAAEAMGLLPRIRELAYRVDEASLLDERGRRRASIRYTTFARTLRDRLCGIMRPDLESALREQLPSTVDLRYGAPVTGVTDLGDRVRVTAGDHVVEADLLVGADGVHSAVRRLVFGEDRQGRVVLVGDACCAVSLIAGQGASLGIAGAYVLGEQLTRSGSFAAAFAEYERLMRPEVSEKQGVARRSARWFLPATPLQLRLRRVILSLARIPFVDRYVAVALAGKSSALITNLRRASAAAARPAERA